MSKFSIANPYFIIVVCLVISILGIVGAYSMPVDLFPPINLPQVIVATFFTGMPPEDIEADITYPLERFFTLANGVDHIESRSMLGISMIRVFFQPGTNADSDVTQLSNLALADLKRLPPGTLPPVVLKSDASSLPVCLIGVSGEGLTEAQLHDNAQIPIRNQIVAIQGAEIPPPFGGKYRQIMVYVDPFKLFSRELSPIDVVNAVNDQNLILPAGDVKMGPFDYYVYSNSLVDTMKQLDEVPLKAKNDSWVRVSDVGKAEDSAAIQYNIVRVAGQKSTYIPIMKAGGDTSTLTVVNQVKQLISHLYDVPSQLKANLLFDQSVFVREAINTVGHEGLIGLVLTGIMILLFLGNGRATGAVMLSIPLSALSTVIILKLLGATINTMILAGIALAFSRVIDNSVISLENIYRHLEMGSLPRIAAEIGGSEVVLAVLAATLVDVVDFFPVTFLYGVSKFLFSALALAFCISLMMSFVVAMTVIPLFCSRFLRAVPHSHTAENKSEVENEAGQDQAHRRKPSMWGRFNEGFNRQFNRLLDVYEKGVRAALKVPVLTVVVLMASFVLSLGLYPLIGLAFFPQTDAGQFTINLKAPTGTRIELTNDYVAKVEDLIKKTIPPEDFRITVSNIGVVPDFSALYTTNAGPYTATIQTQLTDDHKTSSYVYMAEVQRRLNRQFPELRAFFQTGAMVDAIINTGMPAPIDIQVSSPDTNGDFRLAREIATKVAALPETGQIYIPQDMDYPGIRMNVNRVHAAELGLTQKDIVNNVITALNSDLMIAPNYWVDRKTGNNYFLTVQYYEQGNSAIHDPLDLTNIPLRAPRLKEPTTLDTVVNLQRIQTATEIDHYKNQRSADVYVTPKGEALNALAAKVREIVANTPKAPNMRINLRGMVVGMEESFKSFGFGFLLSFLLLYLILVAQFKSFADPVLIMLAIPMSVSGVLLTLLFTHTTLNVMSLIGVLMLVGIANSNSILIVDFAHRLEEQGMSVADAVITACRVRLRPILMTSLATIIGMIPMALKMGTGSEQYAPMARAIIGGLTSSVILTVFIVPAAYLLMYRHRRQEGTTNA
ncbi:MAG TPA: efflux RND transporter permease subunit [Bryobacteraceae bacterium]|nr:efflux RND transporter permease subunit [Bryobacteraceae bacterium]